MKHIKLLVEFKADLKSNRQNLYHTTDGLIYQTL